METGIGPDVIVNHVHGSDAPTIDAEKTNILLGYFHLIKFSSVKLGCVMQPVVIDQLGYAM
jgi:hypothetical protein